MNKEEFLAKLVTDYDLYFSHCLRIVEFGTKKLIPFKMNPVQRILHSMAERMLRDEGHVRIVVLKARRFGISTYIQSRFFKHSATRFNRVTHICTHDKATTKKMFNMTKLMERHYPKDIKPENLYSGKEELHWGNKDGGGLNSIYGMSTVGGAEVRGDAIDYLHNSEVASWGPGGAEYALGLENCVVQGFETEVFLESTAQGVGGYFHDEFWRAYNGESGYIAAFFPWFIYEPYSREFKDEEEKEKFKGSLGKEPRYGGKVESDLLGLKQKYKTEEGDLEFEVTLENLHWRRKCIDTQCQGDLDKFRQEYPSTPRDAFISTGRSVFSVPVLDEMRITAEKQQYESPVQKYEIPVNEKKDVRKGAYKSKANRYYLNPDDYGRLKIYYKPNDMKEYRIGADVSEGLEISNRDTDYSVAQVLEADTYRQVAVWRGKIDPDLFGWVLASLGLYYNKALIGCESNNHGLTTLKFLQEIHNYPNIYYDRIQDERGTRQKRKLGWGTTSKTKPMMIDFVKELVREELVEIFDLETLDEMMTYVQLPNGKMEAQLGSHDDTVMSYAIACQMCRMYPPSQLKKSKYSKKHMPMNYFSPV